VVLGWNGHHYMAFRSRSIWRPFSLGLEQSASDFLGRALRTDWDRSFSLKPCSAAGHWSRVFQLAQPETEQISKLAARHHRIRRNVPQPKRNNAIIATPIEEVSGRRAGVSQNWRPMSRAIVDSEAANDLDSIANTAVPAEFAAVLTRERFNGRVDARVNLQALSRQ
jgi:hypothetical protein